MVKIKYILSMCLLCMVGTTHAALIHLEGTITNTKDVVFTSFTLGSDTTGVSIWTDSYNNGANFDPIISLWTSAGNLIDDNDDNTTVSPATQTRYDAGLVLDLLAGDYILTLTRYPNDAVGDTLALGFEQDNTVGDLLSSTNQSGYWSLWLSGVDSASVSTAIPEPASLAMFAFGLLGLGFYRRKNKLL